MKTTKDELIEARRLLVDHIIQKYVNDETFKIVSKLVDQLEEEINKR